MPVAVVDIEDPRTIGPFPLSSIPGVLAASDIDALEITYAVRLIDRRTGMAQRINGKLFTVYTKHPQETVAEMMRSRSASCWEARVAPLITREVAR